MAQCRRTSPLISTRDFTLNFTLSRRRPYLSQPLSLTSFDSSPAGEPCGAVQTRCTVPYPSRSDRFNGVTGSPGGLRGEIEIFPGPPAKKVIRKLLSLLFISTPQSIAKPSPGWNCALQLKHSHGGPPMTAPTPHPINFSAKNKETHCVPSFLQSLMLIRRQADFAARISALTVLRCLQRRRVLWCRRP